MGLWSRMFGRRDSAPADMTDSCTPAAFTDVDWYPSIAVGAMNFGTIGPTVTLSMQIGSIANTLQACSWAYLGVVANAEAIAELPPVVQSYRSGQWVKDEVHPLNRIIKAPLGPKSEGPNWAWSDWLKVAAIHLQMSDYGFVAHTVTGVSDPWPLAMWPAIFNTLSVDENLAHWPIWYRHGQEVWRPSEVVHLRKAHPSSYSLSMSAFRAALPSIRIDAIARQRVEANLNNRIAPGCIITIKGLMNVSEERRKATIDAVRSQVGLSTQDGTPLVGGEGWEIIAPPANAGEAGASPARAEARREILAAIGYPEVIATVVEGDRSSQSEKRIQWWERTLFGLCRDIYGQLTAQLVPEAEVGKVRLWYDLSGSDIALSLLEGRARAAKALTDIGYSTNDAAARVQLDMPTRPELDNPNRPEVIAGRTPAAEQPEPDDDAPEDDASEEDEAA